MWDILLTNFAFLKYILRKLCKTKFKSHQVPRRTRTNSIFQQVQSATWWRTERVELLPFDLDSQKNSRQGRQHMKHWNYFRE
jgi:hypothetical protein